MTLLLTIYIYSISALFGLAIGSFLNVVNFRTEKDKGFGGRSYCPKCKKQLKWQDNIPLISFFLLGGKCRYCKKKISWQYPVVEFITAILFVFVSFFLLSNYWDSWIHHYFGMMGLMILASKLNIALSIETAHFILRLFEIGFLWTFIATLISIFLYDIKHLLIPNSFTFFGIVVTFIYGLLSDILFFVAAYKSSNTDILKMSNFASGQKTMKFIPEFFTSFYQNEPSAFLNDILHYKFLFPVPMGKYIFDAQPILQIKHPYWELFLGTRLGSGLIAGLIVSFIFFAIVYLSKETWMGMGDVKLVFLLGFFLGTLKTVIGLFAAFEIGAVVGIILIILGRAKMKTALPFGPFLIIGTIIALLFP